MTDIDKEPSIQVITLSTPNRGFGTELDEVLRYTSLDTPCVFRIDDLDLSDTEFKDLVLSDEEKDILQLCTNEFTKIPTSKYATEITKRMYQGEVLRGDLLRIFKEIIVPKVRILTGWEERLDSDSK